MTANQIAYWNLQEAKRSHTADEQERNRSNVARETETMRTNVENERIKQGTLSVSARRAKVQNVLDAVNAGVNAIKGITGSATSIGAMVGLL